MLAGYLYLHPEIKFKVQGNKDNKQLYLQSAKARPKFKSSSKYVVNEIAMEILQQFDGRKTYEEIIQYFIDKYNEPTDSVERKIKYVLDTLATEHGYQVVSQSQPAVQTKINEIISEVFPEVVSIELTNNCNMRCKHCYGKFDCVGTDEIPKEKLQPLFASLSKIGVSTVELTGGDPSQYRYTSDAIRIALEEGVGSIMLLTNGADLSDELVDTLEKYTNQLFVQIDLHSLDEGYFDWFTGSVGNLPKVIKNIDMLISRGIRVRVCSIFTPGNYHEIKEIAEWVYNRKAFAFAPSLVVELGRASDSDKDENLLFISKDQIIEFGSLVEEVGNTYPKDFIRKNDVLADKINHCGALLSSCSIRADGELKLCTMDSGDDFALSLGNVLDEPIDEIYAKNRDFINDFSAIIMPKQNLAECMNCANVLFCSKCLLRGFLRSRDFAGGCDWYKNHVPQSVQERFPM